MAGDCVFVTREEGGIQLDSSQNVSLVIHLLVSVMRPHALLLPITVLVPLLQSLQIVPASAREALSKFLRSLAPATHFPQVASQHQTFPYAKYRGMFRTFVIRAAVWHNALTKVWTEAVLRLT